MHRVIHFEIPADQPERAIKFYADVFGWKTTKWDGPEPYWLVATGDPATPGINGGLMNRHDPAQPWTNVVDTPDIDDTIGKIEAAGGEVVVPKMEIPGVGVVIYAKDTERNIFGVIQPA